MIWKVSRYLNGQTLQEEHLVSSPTIETACAYEGYKMGVVAKSLIQGEEARTWEKQGWTFIEKIHVRIEPVY